MVIYSNSVKNVLDRLFLEAAAFRGNTPTIYNNCISALQNLERCQMDKIATAPFAWVRDKMYTVQVGRYCFSYRRFPNSIIVEEVYDTYIQQIIYEGLQAVVSLFERMLNT